MAKHKVPDSEQAVCLLILRLSACVCVYTSQLCDVVHPKLVADSKVLSAISIGYQLPATAATALFSR